MVDYLAKSQLDVALKGQTTEIVDVLQSFIHQVYHRFNNIEKDISDIRSSLGRLTNTIDGFLKRYDKHI